MGPGWKYGTMRWGRVTSFALLTLLVPMILAACGGNSATNTPSAASTAATTGGATTTTSGSAVAATRPAGSAASGTSAPSGTAAAGSAVSGTTAASGGTTASTGGNVRGTAPTKHGGGGTLHLLWWQAPTTLNNHAAQGTKDEDASRVILEPLAVTTIDSVYPNVPMLAKSIPSTADGSVAADGTSVTWKLRDGVKWSDGTPFTADDVKATWQYIMKPENGATDVSQYENIASMDTPDPMTVKITFKTPTALWYRPFTNLQGVVNQKKQIDTCTSAQNCILNTNPTGTGPYKVKSFNPGDNVQYTINDSYWDPNAPFYDAVDLKGGGDAGTAAKAVQTGQVDYAWNLQVTPDILKQVTDAGKVLDTGPGFGVERVIINFSDPNKDVNGEKSSLQAPHPVLTDPKVRQALSYLMDRDSMAKNLYGPAGKSTCNILLGIPPQLQSKSTSCSFDMAKANQILDDAGWKKGSDGIRAKNGVKMQFTFSTSVNSVREKEEQVMKQAFQQAGISMDIKNADASVYFGQPDNPDAASRFERDLEMLTNGPSDPDAQDYLAGFTTAEITQKANGWKGNNYGRWSNPDYDNLYNQLTKELNPEKRAQMEVQLNDMLINNYVIIPLIDRYSNNGHAKELVNTNYTPWDSALWNIGYWQKKA